MGIFDPKVDTEVSYQTPVQEPSQAPSFGPGTSGPSVGMALAETGAGILEAVGKAISTGGGGGGGSSDAFALTNFQNTIMKAEAARAKGDMNKAERLESTAVLNLQRNGVSVNDNVKSAYSAITGRPGDELFFSRDQLLEQRVMETPEYESALMATYASDEEMTMEQRHEYALGTVARQQGQAQTLLNQQIGWTEGKRDAFSSAISDFENVALGTLRSTAKERGFVGQDQLRTAQIMWEEQKSGLYRLRPEGVTDTQWSQIEDRISRVDAQFEILNDFSSAEGIEGQIAAEFAAGIQSKEDWSPSKKVIGLTLLKDADALGAIELTEMKDMVEGLIADNFETPIGGTIIDEEGNEVQTSIPKVVMDTVEAEDAEKSFNRAQKTGQLMRSADGNKVETDPTYREDFFKTATLGFAAMTKIGQKDRRFLTADGINEVFNDEFLTSLKRAGASDPVKGRAVANIGFEALDQQFAIATGQLRGSLSDTALRLNENDEIVLNREVLLEKMEPEMFARLERNAEEYYNGNVLAMIEDRGKRVPRKEFDPATDDPMAMEPAVVPGAVLYRSIGDITLIRDQHRSVKAINKKRRELRDIRNSFLGSDDDFQGSQGSDTLGAGANRMLALIDKTEGGADYNTLFKFSNREGREFAGVKVSNMTLGELSDFSQGAYADWSKGQLGYVATPMGRYQIVGDTLRQTMKEMGLPRNMVFTPEVQDAMFHHIATKALSRADTPEGKREAMRATWEGFKNVSNKELDRAIAEFEGTSPPSYVALQRESGSMDTTPSVSIRPEERQSADLQPTEDVEISGGDGSGMATDMAGVRDSSVAAQEASGGAEGGSTEQTTQEAQVSQEEQRESGRAISEQQRNKASRILKRLGVDATDVPTFNSVQEAQEAVNSGTLEPGDVYIVDGQIEVVEEA